MKLNLKCIIVLLLIALLMPMFVFISYLGNTSVQNIINGITSNETEMYPVENWYLEAESRDYKIYFSGVLHGDQISVVDKNTNSILIPDSTCEVEILKRDTNSNNFYNDSVGILILGPYKTIRYKDDTKNTFTQTVQNAGCLIKEGEITLIKSEGDRNIQCEIKVQYEPLDCQSY